MFSYSLQVIIAPYVMWHTALCYAHRALSFEHTTLEQQMHSYYTFIIRVHQVLCDIEHLQNMIFCKKWSNFNRWNITQFKVVPIGSNVFFLSHFPRFGIFLEVIFGDAVLVPHPTACYVPRCQNRFLMLNSSGLEREMCHQKWDLGNKLDVL